MAARRDRSTTAAKTVRSTTAAKTVTRGLLTREQFDMRLDGIEEVYFRAVQSAKALQMLPSVTAREVAMQMNQNLQVLSMIAQLQVETNIHVAYTDGKENPNGVPFPPILKRTLTEGNFDRGF